MRRFEDTTRYEEEPPNPDEPDGDDDGVIMWALHEPANFDEKFQLLLQPGTAPGRVYEVSWARLRTVQAWDEKTNGQLRMMPKLTYKHFHRDNYDKMNVGMALNIMSYQTVRVLMFIRLIFT